MLNSEWTNNGTYDFLYLPVSSNGQNMSYAFINCTSEDEANRFASRWHNQRLAQFQARKPLNVGLAHIQGRFLWHQRKRICRTERSRCGEDGWLLSQSSSFLPIVRSQRNTCVPYVVVLFSRAQSSNFWLFLLQLLLLHGFRPS